MFKDGRICTSAAHSLIYTTDTVSRNTIKSRAMPAKEEQ